MLKRIALATAAAGFLAAAALPSTASAGNYNQGGNFGYLQFGGPGWTFGFGNPPPPRPVCRPIVKNVKWWDNWGYPHWNQVVVGRNCGGGYGYGAYRHPHQQSGGGGYWRSNDYGDQGVMQGGNGY